MYIDRHECVDVVKYWKAFLDHWAEYEKQMVTNDKDGLVNTSLSGFEVTSGCFQLFLVTHDKSIFYANDRCKTSWTHTSETPISEHR